MKNFLKALASAVILAFAMGTAAFAGPLAYVNVPFDTPNGAANAVVTAYNAANPAAATTVTCTGTTTATCQGTRTAVSITGLVTAATAVSAAMTVTDASVALNSQVNCQVQGYGGTGVPNSVLVTPAAGSFSFAVQNSAAAAALNATVTTVCFVYN